MKLVSCVILAVVFFIVVVVVLLLSFKGFMCSVLEFVFFQVSESANYFEYEQKVFVCL